MAFIATHQESLWWWQYSDQYIISLFPYLRTLFPPFSPFLISLMVSVDVKHRVYVLTNLLSSRCGEWRVLEHCRLPLQTVGTLWLTTRATSLWPAWRGKGWRWITFLAIASWSPLAVTGFAELSSVAWESPLISESLLTCLLPRTCGRIFKISHFNHFNHTL